MAVGEPIRMSLRKSPLKSPAELTANPVVSPGPAPRKAAPATAVVVVGAPTRLRLMKLKLLAVVASAGRPADP
jgi:hypothetical protein